MKKTKIGKKEIILFSGMIFLVLFWLIYSSIFGFIELSIVPSPYLDASHEPEKPEIAQLVLFKLKYCDSSGCIPCSDCKIDLKYNLKSENVMEQKNISLNKSGEIEFYFKNDPTWIIATTENIPDIPSYLKMKYRIPQQTPLEKYIDLWSESLVFKSINIFEVLLGLFTIYNIFAFLREKLKKKKRIIIAG